MHEPLHFSTEVLTNSELQVAAGQPNSSFTKGHQRDGWHSEDTVYTGLLKLLKALSTSKYQLKVFCFDFWNTKSQTMKASNRMYSRILAEVLMVKFYIGWKESTCSSQLPTTLYRCLIFNQVMIITGRHYFIKSCKQLNGHINTYLSGVLLSL